MRWVKLLGCLALLAVDLAILASAAFADHPRPPAYGAAVRIEGGPACAHGRYAELLRVVRATPQDRESYGDFRDYGLWTGEAWAGETDLPPAYWVLHDGVWYLWAHEVGLERDPTAGGRYTGLVRTLRAPDDAARYGEFNDYGHWVGPAWVAAAGVPPAYWVYFQGTWYLWSCRLDR